MTPTVDSEGLSYSYRVSAMGAPRVFHLSPDTIDWDAGRRQGRVPYASVRRLRLAYRPSSMQSHRFIAEIWSKDAPKLTIVSTSTKGMFEQVRQDHDYRAFMNALHARLAEAGSSASFETGLPRVMFWAGIVLFVGASLGLAGLTVRAIQQGAFTAAALVGAFLAFFLWQAGSFFGRNRPSRYTLQTIPETLLPRGD